MCLMANGPFSSNKVDSFPGVTLWAAANPAGDDVEIGLENILELASDLTDMAWGGDTSFWFSDIISGSLK